MKSSHFSRTNLFGVAGPRPKLGLEGDETSKSQRRVESSHLKWSPKALNSLQIEAIHKIAPQNRGMRRNKSNHVMADVPLYMRRIRDRRSFRPHFITEAFDMVGKFCSRLHDCSFLSSRSVDSSCLTSTSASSFKSRLLKNSKISRFSHN